jgi:hypothetical protein
MRATGQVQEVIRKLSAGRRVRITIVGDKERAVALLEPLAAVRSVELADGAIEATYEGDDSTAAGILQALTTEGVKVSAFSPVDGGLEEAFMRVTSEGEV